MRKSYLYFVAWLITCIFSTSAFAQNVTLTGSIKNNCTKETLPAVSVLVKGTNQGTYTDSKGDFKLTVAKLPVTLVISSVGFEDKEISVTDASAINVELTQASTLIAEASVTDISLSSKPTELITSVTGSLATVSLKSPLLSV